MRRWKYIWCFVTLLSHPGLSQFSDNFSDGEVSRNPAWQGDLTLFTVSAGRLKLQAPAVAGSAVLVTPSVAIHQGSWEFAVQLDFTPSSSNYAKVYLAASQPLLQNPLNGYLVKIGGTSREVSLYVQTGISEQKLIDGLDDRVNQAIVSVGIRVTRDAAGNWALHSDVGRTGTFTTEGTASDLTHLSSGWFGVQCVYTSTRSDKFWFDDFVVTGGVVPDTSPPTILVATAPLDTRLRITASEPLLPESVAPSGIRVEGIGTATAVEFQSDKIIEATVTQALSNGVTYTLHIEGLADMAGNVMTPASMPIRYFVPATPIWKSVLITEILADPTPQVGLPPAEYIEVYNPGKDPFDLSGWELSDGSSHGVFPPTVLLPGEFKVITSSSSAALFNGAVALVNFPSLNNSGDHLVLSALYDVLVDSVAFAMDWYRDEDKADGGWSLELIDPRNPCGEEDNWIASEAAQGGTPGKANSVLAEKPDLTPPIITQLLAVDSLTLLISVNESLLTSALADAKVQLTPGIPVRSVGLADATRRRVRVSLDEPLARRTAYDVFVAGLRDCNGNLMLPANRLIGLTEEPDSLDLRISEVLFNPRSGGVDFVEIFNASDKFIELESITVSNGEESLTLARGIMAPGTRVSFTEDADVLNSQYPLSASGSKIETGLPSLPDNEGEIVLTTKRGLVVDHLHYDHAWHSALLQDEEGVSLERIDLNGDTEESANWQSASAICGYATPGLDNSQRRSESGNSDEVRVQPEIFSPGRETFDFVQIRYRFDRPGLVGRVCVLDGRGVLIKEVANNELLGTEGSFRWDGERDDGRKAPLGYYVVWMETIDPSGGVATFRKRVVIAGR